MFFHAKDLFLEAKQAYVPVAAHWRELGHAVIEPAASLIHARMHAAIAGLEGKFTEGHELPWKVPKEMIGRRLSKEEVQALLAKFERG